MIKGLTIFGLLCAALTMTSLGAYAQTDSEFEPGSNYSVGDKTRATGKPANYGIIENFDEDMCVAGAVLAGQGTPGICADISQGGRCYYAGFRYVGMAVGICSQITNDEQDRCAAEFMKAHGMPFGASCL